MINGFTGFIRAAGPSAAIIYIELGLLIGYWIWVFYWWRTNRPKTSRSAAKKPRARQAVETVGAEVRKAVDLEEAVARERNRRRKAQLQRTAGKVGSQVGSGLNQLRYVIAGILILSLAIVGYQAYDTNRKQEQARIEQQIYKDQTVQATIMWSARNTCVVTEWEQRWRAWYLENSETQTINVYDRDVNSPNFGIYQVTKTLPLPESIDKITLWGTMSSDNSEPKFWFVSQGHFKDFEIIIRNECELKFPPPEGLSESDIDEGSMALRVSYSDLQRYRWQDPFRMLGSKP